MRWYISARKRGSKEPFQRVGRHKRTGKFYWWGSRYGRILRKRGVLRGTVGESGKAAFIAWAKRKDYEVRWRSAETKREALVRVAKGEIGVCEVPLGSNGGNRVEQYQAADNLPGGKYAWCCSFVVWCCKQAGINLPSAARTASVWYFYDWARKAGRVVNREPQPGDALIFYGTDVHIGICSGKPANGRVPSVDGNTTPDGKSGSQWEGTSVAPKNRERSTIVAVIDLSGL
jgi:hypothetical protein